MLSASPASRSSRWPADRSLSRLQRPCLVRGRCTLWGMEGASLGEKFSPHCLRPHSLGMLWPLVFLGSGLPIHAASSGDFFSSAPSFFSKTCGSRLAQSCDSLRPAPCATWRRIQEDGRRVFLREQRARPERTGPLWTGEHPTIFRGRQLGARCFAKTLPERQRCPRSEQRAEAHGRTRRGAGASLSANKPAGRRPKVTFLWEAWEMDSRRCQGCLGERRVAHRQGVFAEVYD